jgi:hypothetical protein
MGIAVMFKFSKKLLTTNPQLQTYNEREEDVHIFKMVALSNGK